MTIKISIIINMEQVQILKTINKEIKLLTKLI